MVNFEFKSLQALLYSLVFIALSHSGIAQSTMYQMGGEENVVYNCGEDALFTDNNQIDGGGAIPGIPSPPPSLSFRFKA